MCVTSMIGQHYGDKFNTPEYDWMKDWISNPQKLLDSAAATKGEVRVLEEKVEALKKEMAEMKALLERALKYDQDNNEKHCEHEEKWAKLRQIAALVDIDIDELLKHQK
jgi:dsDNA-binding SOS-regulon protein